MPLGGKLLLQRAIDIAAQSQAVSCTVVIGANAQAVLRHVDSRRCAIVENSDWREGIASSIRAGLALHLRDAACIFMVADQPFVTTSDVNMLIALHACEPSAIVALRSGDVWGTPALFPRSDFQALRKLRGDAGAKRYAHRQAPRLRFVDAKSRMAFADVDTEADYQRLAQRDPRT